eukprot:CAMPEP_0117461174 /NCGR_PEP_ID=MMETSP0784-20121206/2387_1 /TAXON_ID=39447 /ORGANISM="" /LENGTH=723 /DNA_ID=CAMNT_0005254869 /DNA_START=33 /DNA_END=2204 /DNA_ORIENTATION=+
MPIRKAVDDPHKKITSWYAPSRNSVDVSVFMHGLDFVGALKDFYDAAGAPGLPPRFALGTMYTRWLDFDSDSVMSFVDTWDSHSMPLDAWIFDMNWHTFGPWGSFTWNDESFPRLQDLLDWISSKGLRVGANTHDADGIRTDEKTYKEFCAALGRSPDNKTIHFDLYNWSYAYAQEYIAYRAIATSEQKQGIDFAWIDYQQGETETFENTTIPNINPTIVLNDLRSNYPGTLDGHRSLILSRWGGLGNHRYPLGFSGDQEHDWKGLNFLPYFTSTAANVGFNYWSHDTIGGDHNLALDFELTVRWVQTSAWSPVMRFHDKGASVGDCATTDVCARSAPWQLPGPFFEAVRRALWERDEMLPYIYTAAFTSAATGLALVRPMYYEAPGDEAMYGLDHQYLFGPDMIISPITRPSGPDAIGFGQALGALEWSVFAPKSSRWVDRLEGDFFSGMNTTSTYGIFDVPGLVREGAVIPMRPRMPGGTNFARARRTLDAVEFRVMPAKAFYFGGAIKGDGLAIDDDGLTTEYMNGSFTETRCAYSFEGRAFTMRLTQKGDFVGRPKLVTVKLSFPQLPPLAVMQSTANGAPPKVEYSHELLGSVLTFEGVDLAAGLSVTLAIDAAYPSAVLPHFVGMMGKIRRARYAKNALDAANVNYGQDRVKLTRVVLSATRMSPAFAASMPDLWSEAAAQVTGVLATDVTLKKDDRRSTFVRKIIQLPLESAAVVV